MSVKLSAEDLEALRQLSTPTVSNAVEVFNLRGRQEGFMSPSIQCLFPDLGVMVGYAVTARFTAEQPAHNAASRQDFWNYILEFPEPRVIVMQDLDQPCGVGAYFGEVQANIHRRLGCAGVVTNGHVRDLDEVHDLGFQYFAGGPCVSHAYVQLVDFGVPVKVGGVVVKSGDLIHGDKHGVLTVPAEVARDIPAAAAQIVEREQEMISFCTSSDFSVERLYEIYSGKAKSKESVGK